MTGTVPRGDSVLQARMRLHATGNRSNSTALRSACTTATMPLAYSTNTSTVSSLRNSRCTIDDDDDDEEVEVEVDVEDKAVAEEEEEEEEEDNQAPTDTASTDTGDPEQSESATRRSPRPARCSTAKTRTTS